MGNTLRGYRLVVLSALMLLFDGLHLAAFSWPFPLHLQSSGLEKPAWGSWWPYSLPALLSHP